MSDVVLFNLRTPRYEWLSNMYLLTRRIYVYPSVEHYYQASKTLIDKERQGIMKAPTGQKAKSLGSLVTLRSDWESIKMDVMAHAIENKFREEEHLQRKLLDTGERELIHYCPWGDSYWGVNKKMEGENHQGMITMNIREVLRHELNNTIRNEKLSCNL